MRCYSDTLSQKSNNRILLIIGNLEHSVTWLIINFLCYSFSVNVHAGVR